MLPSSTRPRLSPAPSPVPVLVRASTTARAAILAIALFAALVSLSGMAGATDKGLLPTNTDAQIRAAWYADGSCLLSIGEHELVGVTGIDADMGAEGARTMVHCDADSGQRMTMLMRGDGLAIGERVVLANPADIEDNVNGSVAWLAMLDDEVAPENTPRRFVIDGRILIRETPAIGAAGTTLNADKLPFAQIDGWLQPLRRHPDPQEPGSTATSVDPEGVTRMACRVRPCAPTPPVEPIAEDENETE